MITISGAFETLERWLFGVQHRMEQTIDLSVEDALDDVIRMLQPVTPVQSGAMKADYTIAAGRDYWELLDTAESPGGYDYPGRVFGDPTLSQQYDALNRTLEAGERLLGIRLDAAITNMISTG